MVFKLSRVFQICYDKKLFLSGLKYDMWLNFFLSYFSGLLIILADEKGKREREYWVLSDENGKEKTWSLSYDEIFSFAKNWNILWRDCDIIGGWNLWIYFRRILFTVADLKWEREREISLVCGLNVSSQKNIKIRGIREWNGSQRGENFREIIVLVQVNCFQGNIKKAWVQDVERDLKWNQIWERESKEIPRDIFIAFKG
jgi:hypothetical protein